MKRIFLTGGTGFFGKSILSYFQRGFLPDYSFVILTRDPARFANSFPSLAQQKNVFFHAGDVRDFEFPKEHFESIIHAGTPAEFMTPGEQRDIILKGNERILSFAEKNGAERILFTSSGAVYGPQPPDLPCIPEDFPQNPVTEYGIAKKEAEDQFLAGNVPVVIFRGFAFTGPYLNRNIHFAIGNFIRDALAGNEIIIKGDGTPTRSYLYADDLVRWLFACLEKGRSGQAYNAGSTRAVSIAELAETVRRVLHSPAPVRILGKAVPGDPVQQYVPDTSKAIRELGVREEVSLEEAIRLSAVNPA